MKGKNCKGGKGGKGRQYKAEGGPVRTGALPGTGMGYGTGGPAGPVSRRRVAAVAKAKR